MTAIIEDPIQLRSKILVWAITTNVTDLIETMPPLGNYTSGVQSKKITNTQATRQGGEFELCWFHISPTVEKIIY